MISDNVTRIKDRIAAICQTIGRNPQDITLVAVTKFASIEKIKEAIAAGITHIAENKVQEGQHKYALVDKAGKKVTCHLIGHLQTNKAKDALKIFDLIQSVDSLKLAHEIDKQTAKLGRTAEILVQVNTSGEAQKYGCPPQEAIRLIEAILTLGNVRIKGLMTMAPLTEDEKRVAATFSGLRKIQDQAKKQFQGQNNFTPQYLSMGMSQDFEIALKEGANMLRIGSAIFKE